MLLRDGREIRSADGGTLELDEAGAQGAYRVEVHVPGAPGTPPVPWLLSNPIYFLPPAAPPRAEPIPSGTLVLPDDTPWHVEKDPGSTGTVTASPGDVTLQYALRAGERASQFVALVADLQGRSRSFRQITFTGQASRPARVSVQLRYPGGAGERWGRSVYLDSQPREIVVSLDDMAPADHQRGPAPDSSTATALLFVVDLTNALPGTANTIRIGPWIAIGHGAGSTAFRPRGRRDLLQRGDEVARQQAVPESLPQHPLRDLPRDRRRLAPGGRLRGRGDERAEPALHVDRAVPFEAAVGVLDGVGVDLQRLREPPDRGQRLVRLQHPDRHAAPDFVADLLVHGPGIGGIQSN